MPVALPANVACTFGRSLDLGSQQKFGYLEKACDLMLHMRNFLACFEE
jgi:hypothetical protein